MSLDELKVLVALFDKAMCTEGIPEKVRERIIYLLLYGVSQERAEKEIIPIANPGRVQINIDDIPLQQVSRDWSYNWEKRARA